VAQKPSDNKTWRLR